MRWAKWSWRAGLAACVFVAASPAKADVPTRLVYVRAPEAATCPDQAALQKAVEARLGHDPFSIWGENTIIATVSVGGGALRARAELVDGQGVLRGSRDVVGRASDCDELILALALAISITLDPMQLSPPPEAKPEPVPPEPQSAPQPEPEHEPESVALVPARPLVDELPAPPRFEQPSVWSIYTSVFSNVGALPGPSAGARVGLAWRRGRSRAGVEFGAAAPVSEDRGSGQRVVISRLASNLYTCVGMFKGIYWCVLGSFGAFRGRGEGVRAPRTEMLYYGAGGTRLLYELSLGSRWQLTTHADVMGMLTRPTFTLNGEHAWRPPPVSTELGFSLLLRFL